MQNEEETSLEQKPKKSIAREVWEYVKVIIIAVIIVLILNNFVIINALVP